MCDTDLAALLRAQNTCVCMSRPISHIHNSSPFFLFPLFFLFSPLFFVPILVFLFTSCFFVHLLFFCSPLVFFVSLLFFLFPSSFFLFTFLFFCSPLFFVCSPFVCGSMFNMVARAHTFSAQCNAASEQQPEGWRIVGPPPCLGGSTHRWVPVDSHSAPVPERDGCGWPT